MFKSEKNKRFIVGVFVCFLASMLLAVCQEASAVKPQYGGVLKIISPQTATNIGDPRQRGHANDYFCVPPAIEGLLRFDENFNLVPFLATAWEIGPGWTSITFTLRKGVKFHDGTDFNAKAVKDLMDMYRATPQPELNSVTSIDVVDDYTVRLNLSKFDPELLNSIASSRAGWVVSPTALKTQSKEWLLTHPVGTGPFKLVSFQRDVSLKYEKFDGYWQKGKPYLDGIEYLFIDDLTVARMAFETGEAHVHSNVTCKDAADLQQTGKYNVTGCPGYVVALGSNASKPNSPFADVRVRKAVSYAVDMEAIAKATGYGFWHYYNQPFPSTSWAYSPAVVGYPYNPQKAKKLLAEAGYPSGFKTKIIYRSRDMADSWTALQGYLSQVGIDAKVEPVTGARDVQLSTRGWEGLRQLRGPRLGMDPGIGLLSRYSSKGRHNVSLLHPADYEAKIFQSLTESDFKKRQAMIHEAVKLMIDKYCLILPAFARDMPSARYPEVHDTKMREFWTTQWIPEDAWLSK